MEKENSLSKGEFWGWWGSKQEDDPSREGKNTVRREVGFTLQRHKHIYEHRLERIKRNSDSGSKVTSSSTILDLCGMLQLFFIYMKSDSALLAALRGCNWNGQTSHFFLYFNFYHSPRNDKNKDASFILLLQGWMLMDGTCESKVQVQFLTVSIFKSRLSSNSQKGPHQLLFNFLFCLFPKTNISYNLKSQQ